MYFDQNANYFANSTNLNSITFGFGFDCDHDINDHKFDKRIQDTLTHCIDKFFISNPTSIISYTCEAKDSHELLRHRLFSIWCKSQLGYCEKLNYKTKLNDSWFCGSILFKGDHSFKDSITAAFYKEFD